MMPLDGIRVLDLSGLAPGPYCTMLLGDLGADVIVVEATPGAGRRMDVGGEGRTLAYNPLRRNKRSIGLNLKDPQAQEAFLRLAESADVVVEGFRPGVVKRLGVDYETVSKRNPAHRLLLAVRLRADGAVLEPRRPRHQLHLGRRRARRHRLAGAAARDPAERHRRLRRRRAVRRLRHPRRDHRARDERARPVRRHGDERRRHVAAGDGDGAVLRRRARPAAGRGLPERRHPQLQRLRVRRRQVALHRQPRALVLEGDCARPSAWRTTSRTRTTARSSPRSSSPCARSSARRPATSGSKSSASAISASAPCTRSKRRSTIPHVQAREMVIEVDHPEFGKVKQVGIGAKFSDTPGGVRRTGPARGEHTDEVLRRGGDVGGRDCGAA